MEALRAQIAALTVENTKLKSVEEGLSDLGAFPVMDKMNSQLHAEMDKELHAEIDKNKKLQEENTKLKGPPPPPPRYART